MKPKVLFIERKPLSSGSIERVFRKVARHLHDEFDVEFQSLPYGYGITAIVKNLLFYRPPPADVYHVTGDVHYISLVLPGRKTVLTVHDLVALRRRTGLRRPVLKKLFFDGPVNRARHITAVSPSTREELAQVTGVTAERIDLIENPVDDCFRPGDAKSFNAECPTVLHIGTAENKNLARLITAVTGVNCRLRIIGELDEKTCESLKQNSVNYDNAVGLDDAGMVEEYRNADIVSFCSTYEGFGLPIVEAQAVGAVVITSNLSPMKEVAGAGALLVDPYDPEDIRAAIERLTHDADYRNSLINAGFANIERFGGAAVAKKYAAIYRNIVKEAG